MQKIFLATSFSGQTDEQGNIFPEYREFVEDVIKALRQNYEVFCAAEYEGWQYYHATAEAGVKKDLEEIDKADILVALLHEKISGGIHVEIGYAVGKNKKVILATQNLKLSYFNEGLTDTNKSVHVEFDTPELLAQKIKEVA